VSRSCGPLGRGPGKIRTGEATPRHGTAGLQFDPDDEFTAVDPPDMPDPEIPAPGDVAAVESKGSITRPPILDHEGRVEDGYSPLPSNLTFRERGSFVIT